MITKDSTKIYQEYKKDVLDIYDKFSKVFEGYKMKVPDNIAREAKKIEQEIFNLMVLGESKSGKSTFINAYIGKEILPMDVRQCTSAIIKIHYGDNYRLTAKNVEGYSKLYKGDEIKEYLQEYANLADEYRNIPVTTINNELILKKKEDNIPEYVIKDFIKAIQKDNIGNLKENEYEDLIRKYIQENAKNWNKIPVELDITYPLPEYMRGITIIDTPGVGAGGNVGIITEQYLNEANAIIFVKYVKGQALESLSFMNFMRNTLRNKQKELIFLLLTGISELTNTELTEVKNTALKFYRNDINEEKIIEIDSKIQLFLNRCLELGTEEKIDNFFEKLEEEKNNFDSAEKCWLKSKGNIKTFEEKMNDKSHFPNINKALDRFAKTAQYVRLTSFLGNIKKEYEREKCIFTEILQTAEAEKIDPQNLENRINEKQVELDDIYIKINEVLNEIYFKYVGIDGIIEQKAKEKRNEYELKINDFTTLSENEISDDTFSQMKKMTMDTVDDAIKFRNDIAKDIIKEWDEALIKLDDSVKISTSAFAPNFTSDEFDQINENAKKETSGIDRITEGWSFGKTTRNVPYHHLKKHVEIVANNIKTRLEPIIKDMSDNILEYLEECKNSYNDKLYDHKKELESEYKKLLEDKGNNEKLLEKIEEYKKKIEVIEKELGIIAPIKEELHVKYR